MRGSIRVWPWGVVVIVFFLVTAPADSLVAAPVLRIGVVDFAVPATLPTSKAVREWLNHSGVTLGAQATVYADLSVGGLVMPRLWPIPRRDMIRAQSALGWRDTDIAVPARLGALAARVPANYLVIGTVDSLDRAEIEPGMETSPHPLYRAYAAVHVQVFTVASQRMSPAAAYSQVWFPEPSFPPNAEANKAAGALEDAIFRAVRVALLNAGLGR